MIARSVIPGRERSERTRNPKPATVLALCNSGSGACAPSRNDSEREGRLMDALPDFRVLRPTTLDDALAARAAHPDSSRSAAAPTWW